MDIKEPNDPYLELTRLSGEAPADDAYKRAVARWQRFYDGTPRRYRDGTHERYRKGASVRSDVQR